VNLTSRVIAVLTLVVLSLSVADVAYASTWTVALHTGSHGEAQSVALLPPSGVAAACTTPASNRQVTVTWGTVAHASDFDVLQSVNTGTYLSVATLTGTAWTSSTLSKGSYSYEVETEVGSTWTSAPSSPSTPAISVTNKVCG
jgi:hypothetical protein